MGERTERPKVGKPVCKDKDSLTGEGKRKGKTKSNTKEITRHLPHADQCTATLQTTATLEARTPPFILLLLHFLLLSMVLYGMEYPFGHFRSLVLDVSPWSLFPAPNLLAGGTEWKKC